MRVALSGDLDLMAVTHVVDAVARVDVEEIVVDLGAVEFIDCSGLRALRAVYYDARSRGIQITMTGASSRVRRVIKLTSSDYLLAGAEDA